MFSKTFLFGQGAKPVSITGTVDGYNLFVALGSPTTQQNVIVTIESGALVKSTVSGLPAFRTGPMPAGSKVKIVNKGAIHGKGGNAGAGGGATATTCIPVGGTGGPGFAAIHIELNVTIDNTLGVIFGGGGGGGGGGGSAQLVQPAILLTQWGGGGGGGGAGEGTGGGLNTPSNGDVIYPGSVGTAGTQNVSSANGSGGAGGSGVDGEGRSLHAGNGGNGGDWGASGANGTVGNTGQELLFCNGAGGIGGAAGNAVTLNGHTVTWLGGNNPTQVKGAVS